MRDLWRDSGFHLLARAVGGHLAVTDDFLRAYFNRPDLRPVEESCAAGRRHSTRVKEVVRFYRDSVVAGRYTT